jgi:general secretion pathway protein L
MTKPSENYMATIQRLKQQLLASRFARWWVGELARMVPVSLRPTGPDFASLQHVSIDQVATQSTPPDGSAPHQVTLTLPPDRVLCKTLTLPLATEETRHQVLVFQVDQLTPFTADQVYFGHRITERDFDQGRLTVDFVATPRAAVDEAIKALVANGATVKAVVSQGTLAAGQFVNMLPVAIGKAPSVLMQGLNPWLALLVGLLALAAMAAPLVIKREAVVQLLPLVAKAKKAAETTDVLRRDLETRVDEHNHLLQKRQSSTPVVMALEELARILPDDTWVQQLDIKGTEMQIQGDTASSIKLIGLFEQSGTLHGASFRAPVVKSQSAGFERYHLALQIRPAPDKKP